MLRRAIALGVLALGIAVGVATFGVARDDPGYGLAGASRFGGLALLLAGWALIGAGVASWLRRPDSRFGPLLAFAGFAWFAPEWDTPGVGSALAFTLGLALASACPPLVAHAVLAYPGGRLGSRFEAGALTLAYAGGAVVLGLLPALSSDPNAETCSLCPANLLGVTEREAFADDVTRVGTYLGVVWALALALLAVRRLPRRAVRPVVAPGAVFLALVAATFAAWVDDGFLANGELERRLWFAEAAALAGVAFGVAGTWVRAHRARSDVARLVVELAQTPPPGGLRDVLAEIVGDPELVLAYPLELPARLVDVTGRAVELPGSGRRTTLVRDGRVVAVLGHAPGLLDDEQLVAEVAAAGRLALENERLQAEVRARLVDLRASRARIVAAGDAERKRLERDLHDGAQQRLVALALSLRLLRSTHPSDPVLERAERELASAVEELRALAHGIFPAVLADDGLEAAVHALAEEAAVPLAVGDVPRERFEASRESAAYTVVAETVRAAKGPVAVSAGRSDGTLVLELRTPGVDDLDVVALEDRLGALDGRLAIDRGVGTTTVRAELPCES